MSINSTALIEEHTEQDLDSRLCLANLLWWWWRWNLPLNAFTFYHWIMMIPPGLINGCDMMEEWSVFVQHSFQVWHTSICFWICSHDKWCGTHIAHFQIFSQHGMNAPYQHTHHLAGCYTVNKLSVWIRVANVFTIISVLTVYGWLEPSACSIIVRPSRNFLHHLNIGSRHRVCTISLLNEVVRFHRWLSPDTQNYHCFIISFEFAFFDFFFLYYIHYRGKWNNFL